MVIDTLLCHLNLLHIQWSYGVTCWEVFTAGEIPYPGIHPQEVVKLLENGEHLSEPKNPACGNIM